MRSLFTFGSVFPVALPSLHLSPIVLQGYCMMMRRRRLLVQSYPTAVSFIKDTQPRLLSTKPDLANLLDAVKVAKDTVGTSLDGGDTLIFEQRKPHSASKLLVALVRCCAAPFLRPRISSYGIVELCTTSLVIVSSSSHTRWNVACGSLSQIERRAREFFQTSVESSGTWLGFWLQYNPSGSRGFLGRPTMW